MILQREPVPRILGVMPRSTLAKPRSTLAKPRSTLTERAMIVSLHLHAWGGQRADKKVTKEVLSARKAKADAGRFAKVLVPPEALKLVTSAHDHARERHNALTLPWGEGSMRILSAALFLEHAKAMAEERAACEVRTGSSAPPTATCWPRRPTAWGPCTTGPISRTPRGSARSSDSTW